MLSSHVTLFLSLKQRVDMMSEVIEYKDGDLARLNPSLLVMFPYGNQRRKRSPSEYENLKRSIKENGIIQNLTVRPSSTEHGKFEVLCGYGRWDAAIELDLDNVPCMIRVVDDKKAFEIHLTENLQREDLPLVDEVKLVQTFVSTFEGDHEAARITTGWSKTKFNERLRLNKCTEDVLDALDDNLIKPQHALLLSSFTEITQNKTLRKIIEENWSVEVLRERIGKVQLLLSTAKFNTFDCNHCQHNTAPQASLFDNTDTKAKCSKTKCYREKTLSWLNDRKAELADVYGTVIMLSESGKDNRNTVSTTSVGEKQFNEGCIPCKSRAAVMSDLVGKEGEVIENQCLNTVCFKKCAKAASKAPDNVDAPISTSSNKNSIEANPQDKQKKGMPSKTAKVTAGTLSTKVTDHHKTLLRQAATKHFDGNQHFTLAALYAGLAGEVRYDRKGFDEHLIAAMQMDTEKLQQLSIEVVKQFLHKKDDRKDLFINLLKVEGEKGVKAATEHWQPTPENIGIYTKDVIIDIAKKSGASKSIENFSKISSGNKAPLVEAITKADINSLSFAPAQYLSHVTTTK